VGLIRHPARFVIPTACTSQPRQAPTRRRADPPGTALHAWPRPRWVGSRVTAISPGPRRTGAARVGPSCARSRR